MNTPPQHQNQPGLTMPQMTNQNQNQPRIKSEPGLDDKTPPQHQPFQNPMINLPNATTAQQRAAQHLQNNYGQRAAASINAIQSTAGGSQGQGQGPPQQQQGPPNPQLMHAMQQQQHQHQQMAQMQQQQRAPQGMPQQQQQQGGQRPQTPADQYRAAMARQAAMQQAQLQSQNGGVNGAQTDGAGDEEEVEGLSVIKRFDTNGQEIAMGRVEIDGLIRRKIEAMGQSMEGGGLMLPLHQASTKAKRQRKVVKKAKGVDGLDGIASMDGPDDKEGVKDEDIDEDAINSDLDDPDDGLNDEEDDDDSMGHIMLCMYDKVQRVKNKWYVLSFLPSLLSNSLLGECMLIIKQEVRHEGWCPHCQWQGVRLS
jgi:transcription initiation factor TFIIA large subunit